MASMTVDNKLGVNRFLPDEKHSHIDVDKGYGDLKEIKRLVLACPAHLYVLEPGGKLTFSHEGCLECGTCRVLSGGKVVRSWEYPEGGMGVEYRIG